MALILCLETSTRNCSVALTQNGVLLALKEEISVKYLHSEKLTVFINLLLKNNSLLAQDLDAIAISKGPGSYTGLRIGSSVAKGLCFALDKPLISISTLDSLIAGFDIKNQEQICCPMIDARRMEVYFSLYKGGKLLTPINNQIIDDNSFSEILDKQEVYFFGDGSDKCKDILIHSNAIFISNIFPSAKNMAKLAEDAYRLQEFQDIAYFEPFYFKNFITGPII